ncbi:hypothetical protein ACFX13_046556 [Malus domestica]
MPRRLVKLSVPQNTSSNWRRRDHGRFMLSLAIPSGQLLRVPLLILLLLRPQRRIGYLQPAWQPKLNQHLKSSRSWLSQLLYR